MCLNPIKVGKDVYPCGKCLECIKSKQLDYSQLMMRQAERKGSCHFVTFTYNDFNVPIKCLDLSTGEVAFLDNIQAFPDLDLDKRLVLREMYQKRIVDEKLPYNRFSHFIVVTSFGTYQLVYSLCRLNFRLWLKRARVRYERKFGRKLSDFTYFCFGEYGEKSWRPHYHCNFYGLSDEEINFIVSDWQNNYGYVLVKSVPCFSTQDIAKVCMYVGKYVSKGVADCPELFLDGSLMEKPRPLSSCGISVHHGLQSLFTLDGKLDFNSDCYSMEDIKRVFERMTFNFGGRDFFLGKHFYLRALRVPNETYKHRLYKDSHFYDYEFQTSYYIKSIDNEKIEIGEKPHALSTCAFKASALQLALSRYLRDLALQRTGEDGCRQLQMFDNTEELVNTYGDFSTYMQVLFSSHEKELSQRRQRQVSKSVF